MGLKGMRGKSPRSVASSSLADSSMVLMIAVAAVSFFAGTIFTIHMNLECVPGKGNHHFMDAQVEELAQKRVRELQNAMPKPKCEEKEKGTNEGSVATTTSHLTFPSTTEKFARGMARTSKTDFFDQLDIGVPMDVPKGGDSEVLVLYNRNTAIPNSYQKSSALSDSSSIPSIETEEALQHCDYVNVILANHDGKENICTAIVPQYESYHVQKWMRLGHNGRDSSEDLQLVSRGMQSNGKNQFRPPLDKHRKESWSMLSQYYSTFADATTVLKPLVEKVATKGKTVTVMVSNFGQSELLANFVCAAKSRNLDTSSILVFATDMETKELAESLGLTAFYDKWNFESIPSEAASRYGDRKFTLMMMAKVMCVQMVSTLGYNILFQDVDIVWYKNPIPFFEKGDAKLQNFDMMFQDDGGHSVRYAPYSANSGFYYVRANDRTKHFFSALLNAGDLVLRTDSHQQALIALMNEHMSLFGLKVKIFSRDTDEFPGGWHFHQKTGKFMRRMIAGDADPYIFHMSWTLNKDNKLLFFQQLGEWYVKEECVHKQPKELSFLDASNESPFAEGCCIAEPIFKCHYKDKPSKLPCHDSPPIDKVGKSWWKK
mmetsp:Transcript_25023/g.69010  ORF Transcript_25023/g.69010 Transcript_25023/m.69010 type:complete len:601 (-) Transcript_25023:23-1825(-)